ncbi:MAG: D-alanyl-D-alanine carboxypeptidase family protein [Candidatus Saccharibacteria bacterium]|nr:D-alanyl-D-alanine carboxypeptidase family protein [Candidatus Saccharibacteria bacterium]
MASRPKTAKPENRKGKMLSKSKKLKIAIISAVFIFSAGVTVVWLGFNPFLNLESSETNITLEFGKEFTPPTVTATFFGEDISESIKKTGEVNSSVLGRYELTFEANKLLAHKKLTITVDVVDREAPVIVLNEPLNKKILLNSAYEEPGFSATDNYDGDITEKVLVESPLDISKIGNYEITYRIKDSSGNEATATRSIEVVERLVESVYPTYINGILLVNKQNPVPADFGGENAEANAALANLQAGANMAGFAMSLKSGYRSYATQNWLYNSYVNRDGQAVADTYSARPGYSEHQTGLAFDVGAVDNNYGETPAGKWLAENAHNYGFIIRYPKNKETDFMYEPWHIRYVGISAATEIFERGITLEEYLGVTYGEEVGL